MPAELSAAIAKILDACRRAGKKCGIYSTGGEQARQFAGEGFDMISVATDYTTLQCALHGKLSAAQGGPTPPSKKGTY